MDQNKTGKFIAELRKEQNMTQQELADRLNVTDRAVGNWENGRRMPDYSILMELCARLNVSVNELLAGERVTPEKKEERFEENIRDFITVNRNEKKKHRLIVGVMSALILIMFILTVRFALIRKGIIMDPDLKYERRLSEGTRYFKYEQLENISFDYEMGVNKYGTIVFRYPDKALERLKTEMFYDQEQSYKDTDELIKAIDEYINYYNNERIKSRLKGLTPIEYRNQALFNY